MYKTGLIILLIILLPYLLLSQSYDLESLIAYGMENSYDIQEEKVSLQEDLSDLECDIRTLRRSRDLYAEKLELAESNLEMAQEQFRLGMISILDLDGAKLDHLNAQLSYNNRYYELIRKQEEINKTLSLPVLGKW